MNTTNTVEPNSHDRLRRVQEARERVARNPYGRFGFHRGPYYARRYLGYEGADLDPLPKVAVDRFIGVGNPFAVGPLDPGETVLNLACGAGSDALIAARRVGAAGRVIGVESSQSMRTCARIAVKASGLAARVEIRDGHSEALPVPDGSIDLVIANGALRLAAERTRVFEEIRRVLRPGGRLYLAELVVDRPPAFDPDAVADLWSAFVGGALLEEELLHLAARAGLKGCLLGCYDCLRDAEWAEHFAGRLRLHAVTFSAVK